MLYYIHRLDGYVCASNVLLELACAHCTHLEGVVVPIDGGAVDDGLCEGERLRVPQPLVGREVHAVVDHVQGRRLGLQVEESLRKGERKEKAGETNRIMRAPPELEDGDDEVGVAHVQGLHEEELAHVERLGVRVRQHEQDGPGMVMFLLRFVP